MSHLAHLISPITKSQNPLILLAYCVFALVIIVGLGAKLTFLSAPAASADRGPARVASMDAPEGQTKNFTVQKIHDMTFVFSSED